MPDASFGGSPGHLHFWLAGYKFGCYHSPIRFDHLLEWLTELRKMLYDNDSFITKDVSQDHPKKEPHRVEARRVLDTAPVSSPHGIRTHHVTSWYTDVFTSQEAPLSFGELSFYWGFTTQMWSVEALTTCLNSISNPSPCLEATPPL